MTLLLGLLLLAIAVTSLAWRLYTSRDWIITDALIIDHRETKAPNSDGGDEIVYAPIVQITEPNAGRCTVRLPMFTRRRERGTVVVRYPAGKPALAGVYHSLLPVVLIHGTLTLAGLGMIAASFMP